MSYKGRFTPKNPHKYRGNCTNIIYRSLWELRLMRHFDSMDHVVEWSSEEIIIPYRSPKDNKIHRYFPDFFVKTKNKDNTINTMIIEVKPSKQTKPPVKNDAHPRRYIKEVFQYGINQSKWEAATKYCQDRNWQFKIFTEKEIGL